MMTKDRGPRYFIFGIVSIGPPSCGEYDLPAVYTNVSHYMPYIIENMNFKNLSLLSSAPSNIDGKKSRISAFFDFF